MAGSPRPDPGLADVVRSRVRELRRECGITQEQLCELAGVSIDAVTRIEGGRRVPNLETLERIAFALSVHPAALMTKSGDTGADAVHGPAMRISALLDRVSPEQREIIVQTVRLIVGIAVRPPVRDPRKASRGKAKAVPATKTRRASRSHKRER